MVSQFKTKLTLHILFCLQTVKQTFGARGN